MNEREYRKFATEKKDRKPTIKEHECPICHKIFVPAPEHIYRDKRVWRGGFVCSYGCMLKSEQMKKEMKGNVVKIVKCNKCRHSALTSTDGELYCLKKNKQVKREDYCNYGEPKLKGGAE